MRLLMILALLLSAIAMGRPAPAQAQEMAADCHGMMAHDKAPTDDTDHARALGHICPGCAAFGPAVTLLSALVRPAVPRLAPGNTSPPSILSAPIPPPPQRP